MVVGGARAAEGVFRRPEEVEVAGDDFFCEFWCVFGGGTRGNKDKH